MHFPKLFNRTPRILKLLLIGDENTGKTNILRRLAVSFSIAH
jgi:GTPase SAR1 family protein